MNIIIFHHAGGNCYSYQKCFKNLSPGLNLFFVELPGRGKRIAEQLSYSMVDVKNDLLGQIDEFINDRFVIIGHSLGALIANELIYLLKERNRSLPELFIASGCCAPSYRKSMVKWSKLDNESILSYIKKLGGSDDSLLTNKDFINFYIPILRADLSIIENFDYQEKKIKHDIPIKVFYGSKEEKDIECYEGWKEETSSAISIRSLEGDHFFIMNNFDVIVKEIQQTLQC